MSNNNSLIKKINILLASVIFAAGTYAGYELMKKKNIEAYIDKNIGQIIHIVEDSVNVKFKKPPIIEYEYQFKDNGLIAATTDNTIIFYYNNSLITPDMNTVDKIVSFFNKEDSSFIDKDLFHELGHVYHNQVMQDLHIKQIDHEKLTREELVCNKMLLEGIATYFHYKTIGLTDDNSLKIIESLGKIPNNEVMPLDMNAMHEHILTIYLQGLYLVRPIIEKYGKLGIENILKNPIKEDEYKDLKLYQKRILSINTK